MTAYQFGQAASAAAGTLDGAPLSGAIHANEDGAAVRTDYSDGVVRQVEFLKPLDVSIVSQRRGDYAPYGVEGDSPVLWGGTR